MSVPNETEYDYHDANNMTAGISISTMGLFGIVCNATMIYIYCAHASERNSFNTICTTRAAVNLYILVAVFGMVFVPTTFLGYTPVLPTPASAFLIASGNAFYSSNENLTTLTAINRFCAIFFPLRYLRIWGMKQTLLVLFLIYAYRLVYIGRELYLSLTSRSCWLYFSPKVLAWMITKNESCNPYESVINTFVIMFLLTTGLNITTFMKITCFYRKKSQLDKNSRYRERKNIRLFFQTVLQDFLYVIDLLFTFQFGGLIKHRLWTFLSGTFIWLTLHSIDGFVMIVFTERLILLRSCLPSLSAPASLVTVPVDTRRIFSQSSIHPATTTVSN